MRVTVGAVAKMDAPTLYTVQGTEALNLHTFGAKFGGILAL